jgi:hypothetical protein
MSIYALRGQGAYDRSRAEPPASKAQEQLDAVDDAIERAQVMLAAAESARGRRRDNEAYGLIEDCRALLNGLETGSRVRLS